MKRVFKIKKGTRAEYHQTLSDISIFLRDYMSKGFYSKELKHYVNFIQENYKIQVEIIKQ